MYHIQNWDEVVSVEEFNIIIFLWTEGLLIMRLSVLVFNLLATFPIPLNCVRLPPPFEPVYHTPSRYSDSCTIQTIPFLHYVPNLSSLLLQRRPALATRLTSCSFPGPIVDLILRELVFWFRSDFPWQALKSRLLRTYLFLGIILVLVGHGPILISVCH